MSLGLDRINSTPVPEGYDALVKDSGGDPFKQISRGRVNFHCCAPILSIYDQQRDASRKAAIATMQKLSSKQSQALKLYNNDNINGTELFHCRRVSEQCTVRAPFMTFLHSTYDRTTTDIANAMTAGSCKVATGSFIFSTKMLTQNEGVIDHLGAYFKIIYRNKVKYISVSFKCDASWSYEHRLDTYLALLTNPVIKDSNGHHYFVNILSTRNSIVFFKIIKNASKGILPGEVTLRLWFDNQDTVVVQCYDWMAEGYDTNEHHMRLVRFEAPKKLVNDVTLYAYGLDHNKFSVSNIFHAAKSFATRIVGTKAVSQAAYDMPPKRLFQLSSAIFLKCFVDRFGITRATSEVTTEIQRLREAKGISFFMMFSRLWRKITTPATKKTKDQETISYMPEFDNPGNIALEGVGPMNMGLSFHERFLKKLIEWSAHPKNYSVHICDAVQFIDITTVIESDLRDLDTKTINYLPCFALDESEDVYRENPLSDEACMIENYDVTHSAHTILTDMSHCSEMSGSVLTHRSGVLGNSSCNNKPFASFEDLIIGTAIGDGNCFFDSVRQLLCPETTVKELKRLLVCSSRIVDVPSLILPDILRVLTSPNAWGGEPEILLVTLHFEVRIVLYSDELDFKPRIYGEKFDNTCYLVLRNRHYEPAFVKQRDVVTNVADESISDLLKSLNEDVEQSNLNLSRGLHFDCTIEPNHKNISAMFKLHNTTEYLDIDKFDASVVTEHVVIADGVDYNGFTNDLEPRNTSDGDIDQGKILTREFRDNARALEKVIVNQDEDFNAFENPLADVTSTDEDRTCSPIIEKMLHDAELLGIDLKSDVDRNLAPFSDEINLLVPKTPESPVEDKNVHLVDIDVLKKNVDILDAVINDISNMRAKNNLNSTKRDDNVSVVMTDEFDNVSEVHHLVGLAHSSFVDIPIDEDKSENEVKDVTSVVCAVETSGGSDSSSDVAELTVTERLVNAAKFIGDNLPSTSLGRGLNRMLGKKRPGSSIKSKSDIKTNKLNLFDKAILNRKSADDNISKSKILEIAELTRVGQQPVYEKSKKRQTKKIKKFKLLDPIKENDENTKNVDTTSINGDSEKLKILINEFVEKLPNRNHLNNDDLRLVTASKCDRENGVVIHDGKILRVEKGNLFLDFSDMSGEFLIFITSLINAVGNLKKVVYINLGSMLDKYFVRDRVNMIRNLLPTSYGGLIVICSKFLDDTEIVGKNVDKAEPCDNEFWKPISNPVYPIPVHDPKFVKENTPTKSAINAVIEIRELWRTVVETAKATYSRTFSKLSQPLSIDVRRYMVSHKEKFAVYDRFDKKWSYVSEKGIDYAFCYNGKTFVDFREIREKEVTSSSPERFVLCGKFTVLMQEPNLINSTADINLMFNEFNLPEIDMVVGVPGCGKTTFILREHNEGDLVLTSTSEGASDIRERLAKLKGLPLTTFKENYRTIDSYLLNSRTRYPEVWIDEALMKHPGEIFLVCIYSGCRKLHMLGDPNQIGYINRVGSVSVRYGDFRAFFKPSRVLNVSYRCPVDVMAILHDKYEGGTKSTSNVIKSMASKAYTALSNVPLDNDKYKYLVFKLL